MFNLFKCCRSNSNSNNDAIAITFVPNHPWYTNLATILNFNYSTANELKEKLRNLKMLEVCTTGSNIFTQYSNISVKELEQMVNSYIEILQTLYSSNSAEAQAILTQYIKDLASKSSPKSNKHFNFIIQENSTKFSIFSLNIKMAHHTLLKRYDVNCLRIFDISFAIGLENEARVKFITQCLTTLATKLYDNPADPISVPGLNKFIDAQKMSREIRSIPILDDEPHQKISP